MTKNDFLEVVGAKSRHLVPTLIFIKGIDLHLVIYDPRTSFRVYRNGNTALSGEFLPRAIFKTLRNDETTACLLISQSPESAKVRSTNSHLVGLDFLVNHPSTPAQLHYLLFVTEPIDYSFMKCNAHAANILPVSECSPPAAPLSLKLVAAAATTVFISGHNPDFSCFRS
jgi:hypothetical protein